jgi:hypothetical protein
MAGRSLLFRRRAGRAAIGTLARPAVMRICPHRQGSDHVAAQHPEYGSGGSERKGNARGEREWP